MTANHLLIDVGNGRTKFGLATRDAILDQRDTPTPALGADGLRELLKGWTYEDVICSSVVPRVTELLRSFFGDSILILSHETKLGIGIKYPNPETIGADRLANAAALAKLYGAPGIVIDFGTAVTFDIVDADACYVGGVIAPGLRLMTDYLHERTALLPRVELSEPLAVIGKSTEQAILAGAAIGYRGMIRGLLDALKIELGNPTRLRVVATGGDAAWIASGLPEIELVDADLTLHGLRLVGNLHAPRMSTVPTDPIAPAAVGVDFGGTSVKIGVCRGAEIQEVDEPIPTADHPGPDALIRAMAERIAKLRVRHPGIKAVGVGVPGLVDFDRGFVHVLTNVPGWSHIPLREILSGQTGLPVTVENDANAMTYAEWRYGAGRDMKNVVGLTLGTGVGGGMVLDGKLYRGSHFSAGEIGQMSIYFDGVSGHYGNLGALEKYVGNQQIAEHAQRRYAQAGLHREIGDCEPKNIAVAAQAGDNIARQVWGEVADWLGTAVASIAWLLNPDAFVIGGGVAQAGALLFDPLERRVRSMLSEVASGNLKILPAKFHNEAGIIGNVALAADACDAGEN